MKSLIQTHTMLLKVLFEYFRSGGIPVLRAAPPGVVTLPKREAALRFRESRIDEILPDVRNEWECLRFFRGLLSAHPFIYDELERLPQKAVCLRHGSCCTHDTLLTFISLNGDRVFYATDGSTPRRIGFGEAVGMLMEGDGENWHPSADIYTDLLRINLEAYVSEPDGYGWPEIEYGALQVIHSCKEDIKRSCSRLASMYTGPEPIPAVGKAIRAMVKTAEHIDHAVDLYNDSLEPRRLRKKGDRSPQAVKRSREEEVILSMCMRPW